MAQGTGLENLPGTYRNATADEALKTATALYKLKNADQTIVRRNLAVQHALLMQTPSLKSFTGLEVRFYAYGKPASALQERTSTEMRVMLYPFTKAFKTEKVVPVDEAPAYLSIYTNDLSMLLFNTDEWYDLTKKAKVPQFFNRFPITDSTENYMEVKANGKIFRILQLNNKPLFVPVTRKEYLQFLVSREEILLGESEKIVVDNRERAKTSKAQKDGYEKIYASNITTWQENVDQAKEKLRQYKETIAGLTPEQASSGAYVNPDKAGDYEAKLAPVGRKDGKALYKINPDYYDKSKSTSAAQVVVVTYWYHTQFCPQWMQSFTKELFTEIDYSALKKK